MIIKARNRKLVQELFAFQNFANTNEQKEKLIHENIPNTTVYLRKNFSNTLPEQKIIEAMDIVADLIARFISYENKPTIEEAIRVFQQELLASLIEEANPDELLRCNPKNS